MKSTLPLLWKYAVIVTSSLNKCVPTSGKAVLISHTHLIISKQNKNTEPNC